MHRERNVIFIKTKQYRLPSKWVTLLIAAGFFLLFLTGLAVTGDYGQHCDENNQFVLVYANMKEYAMRLLHGGMEEDILKWFDDRNIVEISASENLDHGIAAYYPIAAFLLTDQLSHGLMLNLWNGYTFCLFFLGVAALYFIGKRVFDSRLFGVLTALAFYLTPRMFAEGHYNNKDLILLCLALVSVWMGLRMTEKRSFGAALFMGTAAAFAANIKIVGAWPFALMGLYYLWELTARKEWSKKNFLVGLTAVISFLAVYVLITPACWSDPAGFIRYLTGNAKHFARWDDDVLFAGQLYKHSRNPLPRTYLMRMIWLTVPVYLLVLWVIGQAAVLIHMVQKIKAHRTVKRAELWETEVFWLLVSLWWMAPLGAAMAGQTLVYNSWRHFYFCYGAIVLLALYGLKFIAEWAGHLAERIKGSKGQLTAAKRAQAEGVAYGIFALCLCLTGIQSMRNHPYQYAYFNFLAGKGVEERYEIDYWVIGGRSVLEELYACLEQEALSMTGEGTGEESEEGARTVGPVTVAACDITTQIGMENGWVNLPLKKREALICIEQWQEADFVVVNTTYSAIEALRGNTDGQYVRDNYREICRISAYGNEIWTVYAR